MANQPWPSAFASRFKRLLTLVTLSSLVMLQACGGGGGGSTTPPPPSTQTVSGGGVKGPLANAIVTAYDFDATQAGFEGGVAGTGSTDGSAAITGLALTVPLTPPYILEFTSDATTTDITTGQPPVITTLRTVLTQDLLNTGDQIYATPLTTMAVDLAVQNADSNIPPYTGDNDGTVTEAEFLAALDVAAAQVVSTLGFGISSSVNIFDTPPLIDDTTDTTAEQSAVAAYRTAVEALTAMVHHLGQNIANPAVSAEEMMTALTNDLADGAIDGSTGGPIDATVTNELETVDPATLPIPNSDDGTGTNTPLTPADVEVILVSEKADTGSTTPTADLEDGTIDVTPAPAESNPSQDGDTVPDSADNCPVTSNEDQADANNNGVGNACEAAPTAVADSINVAEGGTASTLVGGASSVITNDIDNEGDTLVAILDSDVSNGNLTLNSDGTFSYAHNGGETTSDSFTYHVNDGASDSNTVTVTITVTPQNDQPVAAADSIAVAEGGTATSLVGGANTVLDNDTDADGDSLSVVLVDNVSNGALTLNGDGTFSYTHNGGETTSDSFTYQASDGNMNSATVTVSIAISPVNDSPVANVDGFNVIQGGTATVLTGGATSVLTNDTDDEGSVLTADLVSGPSNASAFVLNADGSFSYTHNGGASASDSFVYRAFDGAAYSGNVTVTITIGANAAPVANNDSITVDEGGNVTSLTGGATSVAANDTDAEGDTLSVVLDNDVSNGSLTLNADGTFSYTHNGGETTSDSFTYHVNDGISDSNQATVTITVNAQNDAPVATGESLTVDEGATSSVLDGGANNVLLNDTDVEDDSLTAVLDTGPANATSFTLNLDGTFSYQHNGSETTTDSFTYHANDGNDDSNTVTVNIVINAQNDAPVAVADTASVNEGGTVNTVNGGDTSVIANDTDAEGNSLTAILALSPANAANFSFNGDGTFSYEHDGGESTSDSFTYYVNDGNADSNTVSVTITINPQNDAPTTTAENISVNEGGTATSLVGGQTSVLANDNDVDGDSLTAVLDSAPASAANFTLNADGTFSYEHDGSETTTDSFTYHANDGNADSGIETVSITINPQDDPTTAVNDGASITEDAVPNTVSGNVLTNDSDPDSPVDTVSNAGVIAGNFGSLDLSSNGNFTYTLTNSDPVIDALNTGESETDTFNYTVNGQSADLVITINGVTDGVPPNVQGTWRLQMTVTGGSDANPGDGNTCNPGVGDSWWSYVTITQNGTNLTMVDTEGGVHTGTIDAAGNINMTGSISSTATLLDVSTATSTGAYDERDDWTSVFTATDTNLNGTASDLHSFAWSDSPTTILPRCIEDFSITGERVYVRAGTEDYNGVYRIQMMDWVNEPGGSREAIFPDVFEFVVSGNTIDVQFTDGDAACVATTISNSFDPATGAFSLEVNDQCAFQPGEDAGLSSDATYLLNGLFVRAPDETTEPSVVLFAVGGERWYDGPNATGNQTWVAAYELYAYGQRANPTGYTRTNYTQRGDGSYGDDIYMGLLHPPLQRGNDANNLVLEVLDGASVLCSTPYYTRGTDTGTFTMYERQPMPDFDLEEFSNGAYSYVSCNTSLPDGTPQVLNGTDYTVRVIDTGANGINEGGAGDDQITYSSLVPAEVNTSPFTSGLDRRDLRVGGARVSASESGRATEMWGFFDPSESHTLSWGSNFAESADNFQLRLLEAFAEDTFRDMDLLTTNGAATSITVPANLIRPSDPMEWQLRARRADGNGYIAQAFAARAMVFPGVRGLFNIELGNQLPLAAQSFQVWLDGRDFGLNECSIPTNTWPVSCNPNNSYIDMGTNSVTLDLTDLDGSFTGLAGTNFQLTLNFYDSRIAEVTSPSGLAGVPATTQGLGAMTTSARPGVTEFFARTRLYSHNSNQRTRFNLNNIPYFWDRAVLTRDDGATFGGVSAYVMWDDSIAGQTLLDRIAEFTAMPTDDGNAQGTKQFMGAEYNDITGTTGAASFGTFASGEYRLVLQDTSGVNANKVFRFNYTAPDASAFVTPSMRNGDAITLNGTIDCDGGTTTLCDDTNPQSVADITSLSWPVAAGMENQYWRIVVREFDGINNAMVGQQRTHFLLNGEYGLSITGGVATWTNPGDFILEPGRTYSIQLHVQDSASGRDGTVLGTTSRQTNNGDWLYISIPGV